MEQNITTNPYYSELPVYNGRPIFSGEYERIPRKIKLAILIIVQLIIILFLILYKNSNVIIIIVTFAAQILCGTAWSQIVKKKKLITIIYDKGVSMMLDANSPSNSLTWEQIDHIEVISEYDSKHYCAIYISAKETEELPPQKIVFPYSPKAIHCIMKYYKGTIENLNLTKNWETYINKL